jgi:hypothetical protein
MVEKLGEEGCTGCTGCIVCTLCLFKWRMAEGQEEMIKRPLQVEAANVEGTYPVFGLRWWGAGPLTKPQHDDPRQREGSLWTAAQAGHCADMRVNATLKAAYESVLWETRTCL